MRMHRAVTSRWLRSALSVSERAALADIPLYLCPSLSAASTRHPFEPPEAHQKLPYKQRRCVHVETRPVSEPLLPPAQASAESTLTPTRELPLLCSGCGALSQTTNADQAGYFDLNRRAVREFLSPENAGKAGLKRKAVRCAVPVPEEGKNNDVDEAGKIVDADEIVEAALQKLGEEKLAELGLDPRTLLRGKELEADRPVSRVADARSPLCDRCHNLVHYRTGNSIYHPDIDDIRETIEESPFKHNHIYHIIDAADFPMSFIHKLHIVLDANLKHRNRRNKAGRYYKDRKFDMDFIITRSDLLAPKKEQVDALMPYLREVLRQSLGKFGKLVTLGNVRCVSAHRGWWTKALKDKIYERGGAGWMVGKVNVGKSQLFDSIFPKGTTARLTSKHPAETSMFAQMEGADYVNEDSLVEETEHLDLDALLPPVRAETDYPEMPTVSDLPGTTASPIRIPFGNGKGELIDLPGIARSDLEKYVKPEHRKSLIMKRRIKPTQRTLKPGQSLLLGGLIRITPSDSDLVFLTYNFTPLPEHQTSTVKATQFQHQTLNAREVINVANQDVVDKIELAGSFQLRYDVTKERAGPLTRKNAVNLKVERLPWRVLGIDILIEGVGWVEIAAQVRTKDLFEGSPFVKKQDEPEPEEPADPFAKMERLAMDHRKPAKETSESAEPARPAEPNWPVIDVWSPEGKHIGSRPPMNAWTIGNLPEKHKARPRKSMKGAKKAAKAAKRTFGAS